MTKSITVVLALVVLLAAVSGCGGGETNSEEPTFNQPQTDFAENELVTFSRTILPVEEASNTFTVQIKVTAKRSLELLAASDTLPEGVTLVSGATTNFVANAATDQVMAFEYRIRTFSSATREISGATRAKPADRDSLILDLTSALTP